MRSELPSERNIEDVKYQLAQLAYDIFTLRLKGTLEAFDEETPFSSLSIPQRHAWIAGVWAAVEASSGKLTPLTNSISKKEQDDGYLLYNGAKGIRKKHAQLFTYNKFPDAIKTEYRQLAMKIYEKIEMQGGEVNTGIE